MLKRENLLYCVTAGFLILTVFKALSFLTESLHPTADIRAQSREIDRILSIRSIDVDDWRPGDVKLLSFGNIPVMIWRRDRNEMTAAIEQFLSTSTPPDDEASSGRQILSQMFSYDPAFMAEWLIVSPVNTGGIGCLVIPNAALHDGFFDSCQNVHFDMWGRVMSGPTDKNLIVVPATYVNDKTKIIFDLSNLPEVERP